MNFILESEQRVGSRWVHYLLSDLFGMKPSPEVDGDKILQRPKVYQEHVSNLWSQGRIPKIHHIHMSDLVVAMYPNTDYKILMVARNPRDRAVSVAFHHKHDPGKAKWPQREMSDEEAVRYTVMEYDRYNVSNIRMLNDMYRYISTRDNHFNPNELLITWVAYEWLLEDPVGEFTKIAEFLGAEKAMTIEDAVELHSFSNKAKRKQGEEKRNDVWRRKGVNKDWKNWFTDDMIKATAELSDLYEKRLNNY